MYSNRKVFKIILMCKSWNHGMADDSYPILKKELLHLSKAKAHSLGSEAEQQILICGLLGILFSWLVWFFLNLFFTFLLVLWYLKNQFPILTESCHKDDTKGWHTAISLKYLVSNNWLGFNWIYKIGDKKKYCTKYFI